MHEASQLPFAPRLHVTHVWMLGSLPQKYSHTGWKACRNIAWARIKFGHSATPPRAYASSSLACARCDPAIPAVSIGPVLENRLSFADHPSITRSATSRCVVSFETIQRSIERYAAMLSCSRSKPPSQGGGPPQHTLARGLGEKFLGSDLSPISRVAAEAHGSAPCATLERIRLMSATEIHTAASGNSNFTDAKARSGSSSKHFAMGQNSPESARGGITCRHLGRKWCGKV